MSPKKGKGKSRSSTFRSKAIAFKCHIEASINTIWSEGVNLEGGGVYLAYLTFSNGACLQSSGTKFGDSVAGTVVEGSFWEGELSFKYSGFPMIDNDIDIAFSGNLAFETSKQRLKDLQSINNSTLKSIGIQFATDGDSPKISPIELTLQYGDLTNCVVDENFVEL